MFNFKTLLRDPKYIVSVDMLKKDMEVGEAGIIVDVRSQEDYVKGHLLNSVNIFANELSFKIASLVPLKTTRIFCYCNDGEESYEAAKLLLGMGYQLTYSVEGGYKAWSAKSYPSVQ